MAVNAFHIPMPGFNKKRCARRLMQRTFKNTTYTYGAPLGTSREDLFEDSVKKKGK